MNIVIQQSKKENKEKGKKRVIIGCIVSILFFLILFLIVSLSLSMPFINPDPMVSIPSQSEPAFNSVNTIRLVSESYSIPVQPLINLSNYLLSFGGRFGGVGLFQVKSEDLVWIKDRVLLDTIIDLSDDFQNTQVACYIISRLYGSGYSWQECFLIYVYGFPAVHNPSQYQSFIDFVFYE